jgi:hypothetical protein
MEHDLGSRLDWVGIDHWNTDNPHVHLIVRGADDRGDTPVVHRDYISHAMRERAAELVTIELGPQSEHVVRRKFAGEVDADCWTRLDATLRREAQRTEDGVLDFRSEVARSGAVRDEIRALLLQPPGAPAVQTIRPARPRHSVSEPEMPRERMSVRASPHRR